MLSGTKQLGAWQHQAINWTNVDLSSKVFRGIHLRAIFHVWHSDFNISAAYPRGQWVKSCVYVVTLGVWPSLTPGPGPSGLTTWPASQHMWNIPCGQTCRSVVRVRDHTNHNCQGNNTSSGLILDLCPANKRRRYKVTPSLIGWAQTWNQPCIIWRRPRMESSLPCCLSLRTIGGITNQAELFCGNENVNLHFHEVLNNEMAQVAKIYLM